MISADFYPTAIQFDAPSYVPTFHLTDTIRNCDANAFSAFYWLGWLSWDNLPDCWKLSEYVLTNTDLSFNIATPPQNVNIGFASLYDASQNSGTVKYPECYYDSPLVPVSQSYARYINKLDVMGVGNSGVRFGWHCSYIYGTGDSLTNRNYKDGEFAKSGKALYDFLYGDATETITLVTGITYELDFNNMDEDGSFHFTTTYNDTNYDFVISFSYCASLNMRNVSPSATASTRNVNAYPMYSMTMDDNIYSFINTGSCFYLASGYPACIINKQTMQPNAAQSGNIIGDYIANGLVCDIPKAFANSPKYSRLITGNAHVFNRGSDIAVYRMLTRAEMQKIVGLSLRQSDGTHNTYGYQNELSYAPYITENNEFTATLITGDLSDDAFKEKLRPWQYDENEWEENDYTEDDLPPYDGGGGDDDTDSGGDDIRPSDWTNLRIGAANNFVTLYGMTAETVSDFGRKMWAQLADPEFWQMVGTAFTNDFSINPADMMRYFVSLRYFPFDVSDFAHTTASGIYIGRAATPIAPSVGVAYPLRLSNSTVQVSGGTLTIPRRYNDFRDYEPCTTVQVHIPFCGSVEVPASEVMGHTMDLTYKIDLQTGAMLGVLCVSSNTYYVIATVAGTVGASIPITANNNIEFLQRIATLGGGLVGGGVSGALKGAMLGGEVGAVVGAVAGTVGGGVGALAGLPPVTVHKQGNASGFANLGGVPYAYATVQRSRFELPDNYGHTTGYACDFAATIGGLSGYTVCDNVDTSGLSCNSRERDEIKRLLESGVYV